MISIIRSTVALMCRSTSSALPLCRACLSPRTIARTPDGSLWMAGSPAELLRVDRRTRAVERFGTDAGISDTQILKLFVAGDGRLWVATSGGLLRRADGPGKPRFESVALPGGIPGERFSSIAEDAAGRLWAAVTLSSRP